MTDKEIRFAQYVRDTVAFWLYVFFNRNREEFETEEEAERIRELNRVLVEGYHGL